MLRSLHCLLSCAQSELDGVRTGRRNQTHSTFTKRGNHELSVNNVEHYFNTLGDSALPEKGHECITYQFELEGSGTWYINISDGDFELHEGASELPTTTLKMKGEDYIKMVNGDLNGPMAFMTGKLKISGQIPMAMKLKNIFPQAEK